MNDELGETIWLEIRSRNASRITGSQDDTLLDFQLK